MIDVSGQVIALNAGAKRQAASSFFLPLDRVVRAIGKIQAGEPVTRGTLQSTFVHTTFDEVQRLGLQDSTQARVRKEATKATGLLTVRDVLPGGPASGKLAPGDVVTALNGSLITDFISLESVLDDSVGKTITLGVERGGKALDIELVVSDLHGITPSEYLEVGGSLIHSLSYQMARHYAIPVRGLMVARPSYMLSRSGVPRNAVLLKVNGVPVPTLDALEAVVAKLPDGAEFAVHYFRPHEARRMEVTSVTMDRRWFPARRCQRDDRTGGWPCRDLAVPAGRQERAPSTATAFPAEGKAGKTLAPSLVQVRFTIPLATDGSRGKRFNGAGLVVDAEAGLVVCDRDTVPVLLGDVRLTFGGSLDVPGEVVSLHPGHNLALISYDPASIGNTQVRSATLADKPLSSGSDVVLAAVRSNGQLRIREDKVSQVDPLFVPFPSSPAFRPVHYELIALRDPPPSVGGVLADKSGRVLALWASFPDHSSREGSSWFRGIPSAVVSNMIRDFREGGSEVWRTMDVIWNPMSLRDARRRGLPTNEAEILEAANPKRRQALVVWSITPEGPSKGILEEGDVLIRLNGKTVTRFSDLENASQVDTVKLKVMRDGKMLDLDVPTRALGPAGTERVILWGGAVLQAPHYQVAQQHHQPRTGVYVASTWRGSPAGRYHVSPAWRILEIDGQATPDLDSFLRAVKGKKHRQAVRLRMADMDGRIRARTLKLDLEYWPTEEVIRLPGGWVRRPAGGDGGD